METLSDILSSGDRAYCAGTPFVKNWPQARASLLLIGQTIDLERIEAVEFTATFPEKFEDLGAAEQSAFPSRRAYDAARREVVRLLAVTGHVDKPWEALRALIRRAGREDLEHSLWALASPAKRAGLAPSEIRRDWVWSLEAECRINGVRRLVHEAKAAPGKMRQEVEEVRKTGGHAFSERQALRAAAAAFDRLFDIDEIVAAGLLPPERIGAPPEYDRLGRRRVALPPTLADIDAAAPSGKPTGLAEIWQAISVSEALDLPADPSADDLLAADTWSKIAALPASVIGVQVSSWTVYLQRANKALRGHAPEFQARMKRLTENDPERLPSALTNIAADTQEKAALGALWRRIRACHLEALDPKALLEVEVWRELWRATPDDLSANSVKQYKFEARKALLRHAPDRQDPLQVVRDSWTALPKALKVELAPIRKAAERALLRPREVTSDWVERLSLPGESRAAVLAALEGLETALAAAAARPDPVALSWQVLRGEARARGFDTSRFGAVMNPAVRDGARPCDIDAAWALQISRGLSSHRNALFRMSLRDLDRMLEIEELARLLYAGPIGELPDRRRNGNLKLPLPIARDLEKIGVAAGHADNTCKNSRSIVRELYTRAVENAPAGATFTLGDLLRSAARLGVTGRKRRHAELLLGHIARTGARPT